MFFYNCEKKLSKLLDILRTSSYLSQNDGDTSYEYFLLTVNTKYHLLFINLCRESNFA